ncbi:MAG: GMC family oxidoreductase [Pseudomonadales bacterium]|nr:GMC family oxidoreductase [Pseudomonadales bacterium]
MSEPYYDNIIIGSGAGGSACAYNLMQQGSQRVLMLEKGGFLPKDDSTLAVRQVLGSTRFNNKEVWRDAHGKPLTPGEFYNIGGKTKWYGAALLRFSPHEFEADPDFSCLGWPLSYQDLEPYYGQAEQLLGVRSFVHEAALTRLINRITRPGKGWRVEHLPLGLKPEILDNAVEARHFDGFASPTACKGEAEFNLLKPLLDKAGFQLHTSAELVGLLPDATNPARISGVLCADGSRYQAGRVILAAGAMSSPRILQAYLRSSGLDRTLPCAAQVGACFKLHLNTALLGFSPFKNHDVLRKTAIFFNAQYPHSTVQCLGWLDGDILATQLPGTVPQGLANFLGARAHGFFVTTEDGSSVDNRINAPRQVGQPPELDYRAARLPASVAEHRGVLRAFKTRLLQAGLFSVARAMPLSATAHALGSLASGHDPATSVVDSRGRVHGFDNLFVADGSVLPRSSRVNPALTIYAWGLRLGDYLTPLM